MQECPQRDHSLIGFDAEAKDRSWNLDAGSNAAAECRLMLEAGIAARGQSWPPLLGYADNSAPTPSARPPGMTLR
jgi:hypothetical protein